jgi:dTDP-4-dehydrorhamnose reductase
MSRRIFIAGEGGQLARALQRTYAGRGDIAQSAGRATMDIADAAAVRGAISVFRPDLVINAAAYTAVDRAEDDAEQVYKINRDGAGHVATAARASGAPVIHVSTDYVFDGTKPTPYVETAAPNPIGIYGKSKLAGEAAVAAATDDSVILRTSWLYSADGGNFVTTILRLAKEREAIEVVDDQWGAPTFAADLAAAVADIGEALLTAKDRPALCGVYHATAAGETTWYRFARAILEGAAARGGATCDLRPVATRDYPTRAARPANSRLDGAKLARTFGIRLPPWQTSLERCLDQLIAVRHGAIA